MDLDILEVVYLWGCTSGYYHARSEQPAIDDLVSKLREAVREEEYLRGFRDALQRIRDQAGELISGPPGRVGVDILAEVEELRAEVARLRALKGGDAETERDPGKRLN